jgi:hypothetical protein
MSLHQERTHPEFVEGCFGCKIGTLELAPGDASKPIAQKKWDGELAAYRAARAEGIQPGGTTWRQINAAREASEKLNKPYDANTMPAAQKIDQRVANTMREVGM